MVTEIVYIASALKAELDKVLTGHNQLKRYSIAALLSGQSVLVNISPKRQSEFYGYTQPAIENVIFESLCRCVTGVKSVILTPDPRPGKTGRLDGTVTDLRSATCEYREDGLAGSNFAMVEMGGLGTDAWERLSRAISDKFWRSQPERNRQPTFVMASRDQEVDIEGGQDKRIFDLHLDKPDEQYPLFDDRHSARTRLYLVTPVVTRETLCLLRNKINNETQIVSKPQCHLYIAAIARAFLRGSREYDEVVRADTFFDLLIARQTAKEARGRIFKLSRALAAISGSDSVGARHIQEAARICLRQHLTLTEGIKERGFTVDKPIDMALQHTAVPAAIN